MMETQSISLGNLLFQMELPAFQRLSLYLDDIRGVLHGTDGAEEIVKEVEYRVAELFQEALSGTQRAVNLADVERACGQLGDPSDFKEDADANGGETEGRFRANQGHQEKNRRRWFRDTEGRVLAGVASGIAYRFGVDPIVIRALFIAMVIFTGTGLLFYIILAAIMPAAKTASDRLAMKGDPVTLSSIKASMEGRGRRMKGADGGSKSTWSDNWQRFTSDTLPQFLGAIGKGLAWVVIGFLILSILILGVFLLSTLVGFNGFF